MSFVKFTSLENSYRQAFVDRVAALGIKDWVALEKIHGANFGFIVEFVTTEDKLDAEYVVTPFRRTSTLEPDANGVFDFYGCTSVVEAYTESVMNVGNYLWARGAIENAETFIIYGELAGKGIQKEVNYGEKDFFAYDILALGSKKFLDWELVREACDFGQVKTTNEIARGTLDELLAIDPLFKSTHTPESHEGDNWAEGFVVKPLSNERPMPSGSRAILKVKNEKFKEKKNKAGKTPTVVVFTEEQNELHAALSLYLSENRLKNVISKIGEINQKQFGKLSGLLLQDAKNEFERDERDEQPITTDDWQVLRNPLGMIANDIVRKNWMNILDGEF